MENAVTYTGTGADAHCKVCYILLNKLTILHVELFSNWISCLLVK